MATTAYNDHNFDAHVKEGAALREIGGATVTKSCTRNALTRSVPLIFGLLGVSVFSIGIWAGAAFLLLPFLN